MGAKMTESDGSSLEPPRQETGLYGEPITEGRMGDALYAEAYVDEENPDRIIVVQYMEDDGEWVKLGLEKLSLFEIFNHARELRLGD